MNLKDHVVIHGPIDLKKFIPNIGIVDLPLHIAKSCRYGDAILSGSGEHSISLIGPKVDGIKVQLYVHNNRMYCPFPLASSFQGLWLCPLGVTNIEEYQGEYYSDIYNEFKIGDVIVRPRPTKLTWGEVLDDDMYDGFIFHHLGVQYKVKKEKTYDLIARSDGLYDSNQRVFQRVFKQKSSLNQIFECRAIFDFETKGEFPKFEIIKPRPDKTTPETFSPVVIVAKDFRCPVTTVLADSYSHHSVDVAACCGGTGKGEVHRETCSSEGKCFNIGRTKVCTFYWNGNYFNYNPLESPQDKVLSYRKSYVLSNQVVEVTHAGDVVPYSPKTIKFVELFASKYAASSVKIVDYDGSMAKLMSQIGLNVFAQSYRSHNKVADSDYKGESAPDHVILVNMREVSEKDFPPLREKKLATLVIDRGVVTDSKDCKDIDFLVTDNRIYACIDEEGTLAITVGKKSFIRVGPSYFSVVDTRIVPQIHVDRVDPYIGVLQSRPMLTAADYPKSEIVRANRLYLYQKFNKMALTTAPRRNESKWVLAGIG